MGQPYIGEIRMFAGFFAPAGWAFCDGRDVPIVENDALFNLIGTTYGGDGVSTFALPDLRGRVPLHMGTQQGSSYSLGQPLGSESVTLTISTIPAHRHAFMASTNTASAPTPAANVIGKSTAVDLFINAQPADPMNPSIISNAGASLPHDNCQPFLCISFIISLYGIFPSPS